MEEKISSRKNPLLQQVKKLLSSRSERRRTGLFAADGTKLLEEAAADAARELGVPNTALSVDILPYHYIMKGNNATPAGKKNRFDNLSVSLFVREGKLCLATADQTHFKMVD